MYTKVIQPTILTIPADPTKAAITGKDQYHQARVAAYCRVSTEEEEQQSSYEAQMTYYTEKIKSNPNWELAGIYADEGISGTSTKKRVDFLKMIKQCEKGKIDLILTKSLSRFARNTVDTLQYIRQLRAMNVAVIFEKESIDTSKMTDEIIITTMSMFAQAESESISKNVSWGVRNRFKTGIVPYHYPIFGYIKGPDKMPVINEEEAVTVRMIFQSYLAGSSIGQIKQLLEEQHIKTVTGCETWSRAIIDNIIRNEKYAGDALLQKTFTQDCMTKKVIRNDGYLPKYYVKDNHPAIIERSIFNATQEEIARRSSKKKAVNTGLTERSKFSGKYALTELLICGECGTAYRRCTWSKYGQKRVVWRCVSRLQDGTKYCKDSPTIEETALHSAIVRAINQVITDKNSVMTYLKKNVASVVGGHENASITSIEYRISELNKMRNELLELALKSGANDDRYDNEFERMGQELSSLKELLEHERRMESAMTAEEVRTDHVLDELCKDGARIVEYEDAIVRSMVECIKVISNKKIQVIFLGGEAVEATLE